MKNFITLLGVLLCVYGSAQTTTVTYTTSSAVISNPERGFYKHTSSNSAMIRNTDQLQAQQQHYVDLS
jgi:hypothetical protein